MKITIKSIEAEIIDTSTPLEDQFIINHWIVKYEVSFPPRQYTHIEGTVLLESDDGVAPVHKIMSWLHSIYDGMEKRINEVVKL